MKGTILAIGDVLRQLISSRSLDAAYQRTLIADAGEAEYGGAAWNVVWNLDQLGWTTRMLAQHGLDAIEAFHPLPVSGREPLEPCCRKSTRTDELLVFPHVRMPAIYVMGPISEKELDAMFAAAGETAATIFAGSRHIELRRRVLHGLFAESGQLRVFSPSYTVYEYKAEELTAFLANSDIVVVNRHEAAFLTDLLGDADVMGRARIAGIVTRDQDGADIHPAGATSFHLASTSGVEGDVIGAGDAFISGFVDGFLRTGDVAAAARVAIEVSAQTARSGHVCTVLDVGKVRATAEGRRPDQ